MHNRQRQIFKPQKRLRDSHWPDKCGAVYVAVPAIIPLKTDEQATSRTAKYAFRVWRCGLHCSSATTSSVIAGSFPVHQGFGSLVNP